MFEMRNECRSHLDQQCFQLFVLRVRYQCLVQRIDHGLMIGHLVSDVSAIEVRPFEILQLGEIVVAALLDTLARIIFLRLDLELRYELGRLLVDTRMVRDHLLGERFHLRSMRFRRSKLARVDVHLIGRNDDGRDLRICRTGRLRRGARYPQSQCAA